MRSPALKTAVVDRYGVMTPEWKQQIERLWALAGAIEGSGITADRPTVGLFKGRPYFDTTLGYEIWLKSTRPTVWVNGAGTAV